MTQDPRALHDELSGSRTRDGLERHGYWFPLLLFGVLTFAAIPLYQTYERMPAGYRFSRGAFAVFGTFMDPLLPYTPWHAPLKYPVTLGLYWTAALVLGFTATVWWYRWQARRAGVEWPASAYAWALGLALSVQLGSVPVMWIANSRTGESGVRWLVYLLLVTAVAIVPVVLFRSTTSAGVVVTLSLTAVFAVFMVIVLGATYSQFLVLAAGMIALARVEESRLFSAITFVFTIIALFTNWPAMGDEGLRLLPAGTVLVLGGIAGLVRRLIARRDLA